MKCSTHPRGRWRSAIWSATRICCGTSAERCATSKRIASACACIARRTSAPNDWLQCHGHRSAFSARKSPTVAKATAPIASTSCWLAPPKRETLVLSTPRLPPKTADLYPQKSPQWPGYIPQLIAQVLIFEKFQQMSHVQPFGCSQKLPTFHEESCTYGPNCASRSRWDGRRKSRKPLKINWLLRLEPFG